jgi:transcriptional regulator with XRE-family HTH domain
MDVETESRAPALVRRQLGRQLRRLRLEAGKTHADAETAGMGHRSTLWRIEAGRAKVRPATVRALCWLYGADELTSNALYSMACQAQNSGWWEDYESEMPSWFTLYVQLEAEAAVLSTYQPTVIDGLLQTAEYARAVLTAGLPHPSAADVDLQMNIRRERQKTTLDRPDPLRMDVVLCEAALLRRVGGTAVHEAQVEHLRRLDETSHVDIRVLTLDAGAHPALRGRFTILELPSPADPDVVYLESLDGGRYLEKPTDLQRYSTIHRALKELAIPLKEYP